MHGAGGSVPPLAHGFFPLRKASNGRARAEGPCPSGRLVAARTRICPGFLQCTDTKAQMPLGKAAGGPPTPRGPRQRPQRVSCPCPTRL